MIPLILNMRDRKALFLSRLSRREEAIENALLSIAGFPWNWSTWILLGSCIGDGEEVQSRVSARRNTFISLPVHSAIISAAAVAFAIGSPPGPGIPDQDTQRASQPFRIRTGIV